MSLPRRVYRGDAAVPNGKALGIERSGARQEGVAGADPRLISYFGFLFHCSKSWVPKELAMMNDKASTAYIFL